MGAVRAFVWVAALAVALTPLAVLAEDNTVEHQQAEIANALAQQDQAQLQVLQMQETGLQAAQNERMIAVLKSQAMRERQLNLVANANGLEQLAASLADAERTGGLVNAQNSLLIAQGQAAALIANVDANLANARMLAATKGRYDELLNAQAQADILQRAADYISSQLAEANMANDRAIANQRAEAVYAPSIAEVANGQAMGANELLAADAELQAGALAAISVQISSTALGSSVLGHAAASLANAKAQAGVS